MPKTWQQKYDNGRSPEVERLSADFADLKAGTLMLISTPAEIATELTKIPAGTTKSIKDFRNQLAKLHQADGTCPLTTSIFLRIVSEVMLEKIAAGTPLSEVAPFWRVVTPDTKVAKKLSCGPQFIAGLIKQDS